MRVYMSMVAFAFVVSSCGGSQEPEETTPPKAPAEKSEPQTAEARNESKLREAQVVGCTGYCERVTNCSIEDAKKNMSEKELSELNLAETAPAAQRECESQCNGSQLSVRQVEVMHSCLRAEGSTCEQFAACMDAMTAKPQ